MTQVSIDYPLVPGTGALGPSTASRPKTSGNYTPLFDQPHRVMFLDIETTGLSRHYDYLTLVGYQIGGEYHVLLAGEQPDHFLETLASATSVVTFNGSNFDLPFLEATYPACRWPKHHIDLRYACKRVGLTGGQKAIEQELKIACRDGFEGVDGAMAVILWHRYLRGDRQALRELIEYNRADVRAMTFILDHVATVNRPTDLLSRIEELHQFCAAPDRRHGLARSEAELPAPPTHMRKPVTFDHLFRRTPAEAATVVGLDLTGSAARPSGVCVMRGPFAQTQTLGSDEDILRTVLDAAPDLVSIDSPLCLPVGRTRVTDDDPARAQAGIMRVSERILKRRGVNVYPCLLPSMQRLTERGIRLAAALRERGLRVIECYPGAAQDIIGIPRKGAGEEWLKLGLSDFGVTGAYTSERVTHDELDAITCSVVGFFHLAGLTEGIGGEGEEPMIIPDLHSGKGVVIGISGEMFAGKTTAARILEASGFAYTRISEVIDEVLESRSEALTRQNRQRLGKELYDACQQPWLCQRAIERIPGNPMDIVVDGLRWPEDVAYFSERFGGRFHHIHIDAPKAVRRQRAARLGRADEFDDAAHHSVEGGVALLDQSAEVRIVNNGSLDALETELHSQVAPKRGISDAN